VIRDTHGVEVDRFRNDDRQQALFIPGTTFVGSQGRMSAQPGAQAVSEVDGRERARDTAPRWQDDRRNGTRGAHPTRKAGKEVRSHSQEKEGCQEEGEEGT